MSLGWTTRFGQSRLYFDTEGIYVKGRNEIAIHDVNWSGNATHTRPNTAFDQINEYSNLGHSKYQALVFSLAASFDQLGSRTSRGPRGVRRHARRSACE